MSSALRKKRQEVNERNAAIETHVRTLLISRIYSQSTIGQLTSLFCATILLIGLYSPQNNDAIISWYAFFVLVTFARIVLSYVYKKKSPNSNTQINTWQKLFVVGALLSGIAWAIVGTWIYFHANHIQQALIILIIAGITAGAVPLLAADFTSALVFLSATLVPFIIQFVFNQQNNLYPLFYIVMTAYYIYMILLARKTNSLLRQTIGLQFEKNLLEMHLEKTTHQLNSVSRKIEAIETHDALTGLINRKVLIIKLIEAIKRAEISQKNLALLYINLDNFKFVNDAYGHDFGDQLLKKVVKKISENLSQKNIFARIGGDELVVVLENQENYDSIAVIVSQISQLLTKQFVIASYHITLSASIGVSIYPVDGVTADILMRQAEKAMRYVKEHGRNNFRFSSNPDELKKVYLEH